MDLEQLLALQDLDTRLDQLDHRLTHDQALADLTAAEQALATVERQILELFAERDVVRQEQKRLEDEAAAVEAKIAKDTATLYGGTVTAHKELESLQHELATLKERLGGFDEAVLEQMELAEPMDARAAELADEKTAAEADVEAKRGAVTVMQAEVGAEHDTAAAERAALAATLPDDLLARYEKLRKGLGGQGAARLAPGGRCEGCHLTLPSAEYAELKRAPADEVHVCPECGRILVR
ncbi:MAG: C4-type zinc ribbon domain-containing protein [Acidimicrobiales bacterium]